MVATYRYGSERADDALRVGVARYLPRGIRKSQYADRGYFDLWLRVLSPSAELVKNYRAGKLNFRQFASHYRKEMQAAEAQQAVELLALLAQERRLAVGCFCKDEKACHRSVLKDLLEKAARKLPRVSREKAEASARRPNASPVCYACDEDF